MGFMHTLTGMKDWGAYHQELTVLAALAGAFFITAACIVYRHESGSGSGRPRRSNKHN